MNYQTFQPHSDLESLVKCYWTLEVPTEKNPPRQRIIPDGCIEMIFILGDDIKRYTHEDKFVIQPRELVLGQITEPFLLNPPDPLILLQFGFTPMALLTSFTRLSKN